MVDTRLGRSLAAALLAVLVGCGGGGGGGKAEEAPAAAPKGDGFETSWLGYLSKTYDGELGQCADATRAALKKLDLEVVQDGGGIFQKTLDAEAKDGTSLVVDLKEVTKATTRVSVKVGYLLGDKEAARRIHSEIEGELSGRRNEAEERRRRWRSGTIMPPAASPPSTTIPPR